MQQLTTILHRSDHGIGTQRTPITETCKLIKYLKFSKKIIYLLFITSNYCVFSNLF